MNPADDAHAAVEVPLSCHGLATEFCNALKAGACPEIDTYLQRAPADEHDKVLSELICEEYAHRWKRGTLPTLAEYKARFPNNAELVERAILSLPGQVRYPLLEKLGEGGMGTVFLAKDTKMDRAVAFKVIKPSGLTAEAISRFQQEVNIAKMELSGIVRVYDTGEFRKDHRYIVMQYIAGKTLRDVIEDAPDPPDQATIARATEIMIQVARAVHGAHRRGTKNHAVVHRDLKPENILVDVDGIPYVADFGLAATVADLHEGKSGVCGTVSYMSPEQVRERLGRGRGINTRSDIWSLGVIMYEMVTGTLPFLGNSKEAVMEAIERDVPPPPRDRNTNVPYRLDAIIRKCLRPDQEERYQTAQHLADDLSASLHAPTVPSPTNVPSAANVLPETEREDKGIPPDILAELEKADALEAECRYADAAAIYDHAVRLAQAIGNTPALIRARIELGETLTRDESNLDKAKEVLDACLADLKTNPDPKSRSTAWRTPVLVLIGPRRATSLSSWRTLKRWSATSPKPIDSWTRQLRSFASSIALGLGERNP